MNFHEMFDEFPAHAGMNRMGACVNDTSDGVPRTRGDEP